MASFRVVYPDNSAAANTKVSISVDGGGMATGFTDGRGYVSISTSGTYGKIIVNGRTVHQGSLSVAEVVVR
jgi:hypothetical protein